jgi:hypothetical protein
MQSENQLDLFEMVQVSSKGKTIDEAFDEFHQANPHILRNLQMLAFQAVHAGRKKIGIKFLFERLRWEYIVKTNRPANEYALNNNFTSRYARLLMETYPDLAGVFETREMKSVDGKKRIIVSVK